MHHLISIVFFLLASLGLAAQTSTYDFKRKVEELLIWKVAEELKLPIEIESEFTDTLRQLNSEKRRLKSDVERLLKATSMVKNQNLRKKSLKQYKKKLLALNQMELREINNVEKIIGTDKTIEYLALKQKFVEKLKSLVRKKTNSPMKSKE